MSIKEKIENHLELHLENTPYFLVEVEQKGTERFPRLYVFVDGDNGIDIDACAQITRSVTSFIEEKQVITTEYGIDVSSPGLDRPLLKHRQFVANIGRKLRVWLKDTSKKTEGILVDAKESEITLEIEKGNGKAKIKEAIPISFENIEKAKVMVMI